MWKCSVSSLTAGEVLFWEQRFGSRGLLWAGNLGAIYIPIPLLSTKNCFYDVYQKTKTQLDFMLRCQPLNETIYLPRC